MTASWINALDFYDSLVISGWKHISKFRNLVFEISHSAEAFGLTAVTSHETLIVTPYTRYPDWFEGRCIKIHPLLDGNVRIDKCPKQFSGLQDETWIVSAQEAQDKVLRLIAEL